MVRSHHVAVISLVAALVAGYSACKPSRPCDDYVDYLCSCHEGDPKFDCASLETVYADADPDVQDQCALDLDEQKQKDETEGFLCANEATAR
jgi:hypothetical protein